MRAAMAMARKYAGSDKVIGVEVGVDQGIHAEEILRLYDGLKKLHLVDCYVNRAKNYGDARLRLEKFKDRIMWYLMKSEEAVPKFEDDTLDFVYIDASHAYKDVLIDCIKWYKKVRIGGVLCGHDYRLDWEAMAKTNPPTWVNAHGVVKAVNEFVETNNLKLSTKTDGSSSDWWIVKC